MIFEDNIQDTDLLKSMFDNIQTGVSEEDICRCLDACGKDVTDRPESYCRYRKKCLVYITQPDPASPQNYYHIAYHYPHKPSPFVITFPCGHKWFLHAEERLVYRKDFIKRIWVMKDSLLWEKYYEQWKENGAPRFMDVSMRILKKSMYGSIKSAQIP